ncbi:ROK family glucokinase [Marinitenerispora sediminis]|uniref:Glucokinase n=1 Tax=Marinitenerispora sediminis TaxID=1931232 RepID=A0A368SY39_9ACTN|nr:ROK family glucokinase [Marinitenerispora sediminis]RCV47625.1 glucokinase [Marinitenerispora sediminis]RCV48261.1 glucokinase [Marinitenerispora sediminis]RCV48656.1 glucokinase [Marinitenerispora sediminis]
MGCTIGVDVGGTKIAAGVVDADGRIVDRIRRPTPAASGPAITDAVCTAVEELVARSGGDVEAVGVGIAGFVDDGRSTVVFAPNLALRGEPLRDRIVRRTGLPAVVENDANAAAWGEARFGAGRGTRHLVCVTLGTGIGGGVVLDGRLYRGGSGVAAEIGHLRVVPDGRRCGCGNQGCWEQYASGRALVAEARDLARGAPAEAELLLKLAGGDPDRIEGPEITRAALEGDPAARECFRTVGRWVGQGLADLAAVLDPERFVVGGGVSDAGDILLEPVRRSFARHVTGRAVRSLADIRGAELGAAAGIVGAADLARV